MSAADVCTKDKHEALKADVVKWSAETYPIADGPVFGHDWRNCVACNSTLARPLDEVCS